MFYTDKKNKIKFSSYNRKFRWSGAKSYMTNDLLTHIWWKFFAHFLIYYEALPHLWLCTRSLLNFPNMRIFCFLFLPAYKLGKPCTVSCHVYRHHLDYVVMTDGGGRMTAHPDTRGGGSTHLVAPPPPPTLPISRVSTWGGGRFEVPRGSFDNKH
jgi:hypothetical protein